MAHPIVMPKPGQYTEECTVVRWLKQEGDPVAKGELLFEIETDKSNMDVEAFDDGVLLKRVVEEGQTVPVNSVCAYVGQPGEAVPETPAAATAVAVTAAASQVAPAPAPTPAAAVVPTASAPEPAAAKAATAQLTSSTPSPSPSVTPAPP